MIYDYTIIGAGIAGLALAHQLAQKSIDLKIQVLESKNKQDYWQNLQPIALVEPAFVTGNPQIRKFNQKAYFYSLNFYKKFTNQCFFSQGIVKIANANHLLKKQNQLLDLLKNQQLDSKQVQFINKKNLSEILGIKINQAGIYYPDAFSLNPVTLSKVIIKKTNKIDYFWQKNINKMRRKQKLWYLLDQNNQLISKTKNLICAAGHGTTNLISKLKIKNYLHSNWGLISLIASEKINLKPKITLSANSFLSPLTINNENYLAFGSSWDRQTTICTQSIEHNHQHNITKLKQLLPNLLDKKIQSRFDQLKYFCAYRLSSQDRMPIVGKIQPNFWLLTALGSRGYQYAPLLAKYLVNHIIKNKKESKFKLFHPYRF